MRKTTTDTNEILLHEQTNKPQLHQHTSETRQRARAKSASFVQQDLSSQKISRILHLSSDCNPALTFPMHTRAIKSFFPNSKMTKYRHEFHSSSKKGRRPYMEDSVAQQRTSSYSIFGVFDGHGGSMASNFCSRNMLENIIYHLNSGVSYEESLRRSFKAIEESLLDFAQKHQLRDGTTVLVCILTEQNCWVAHCGDTKLVIVRQGDLAAEELTTDHKPNCPKEEQRILAAGGRVVQKGGVARLQPGKIAVSRSLGDYYLKTNGVVGTLIAEPDITSIKLDPTIKFLVMATDGVWDVINPLECGKILQTCNGPKQASQKLVNSAYSAGSQDNITALIIALYPVLRSI